MKRKGFLLIAVIYVFLAVAYFTTIAIDSGFIPNHLTIGLNYSLKAVFTLPLWFLFFKQLDNRPLWNKGIIHLFTLPIFVWAWVQFYYPLCEAFGFFYLRGERQIWDYYITGLFYIIQFGIFHIYDYYSKMRTKDLMIAEQHQLRLQSELTALKAQLNPHFLYNVFNTINASIPAKAEKTRNMIAKLSDLFRYQLKASKEEFVTLGEELDFVTKYLDLEKERFGKRLNYEISVDQNHISRLIPPLIIQPIVENAVKHGISPLITGGDVRIMIRKESNLLFIEISDTGVGIDKESENDIFLKGVGLSNTNKRLEKMYNKGLELSSNEPSGLVVQFSINLNDQTL
ncbi:MAG: sensor histidine kinase [Ekhidna sp.]